MNLVKTREGEALHFFQVNDSVSLYHHSHIKSTFPKGHFFNFLRELRHLTKYDFLICTGDPILISFSMEALPRYHVTLVKPTMLSFGWAKVVNEASGNKDPGDMASGIFASMNLCEKCLLKPN